MIESVSLWRIAAETKTYKANDLSGAGAAKYPGRWNASGEHVVYAARTLSLAVLETAAYVHAGSLPLNRFVVRIDVPMTIYQKAQQIDPANLDPAWCSIPAGKASVDVGSTWYQAGASALLLAPSAIVPEEYAVIVNSKHPDTASISAVSIRQFHFSNVFRSAP